MSDDDIGIGLPLAEAKRPGEEAKYGFFRYQIQLGKLESRIHTELYSARAQSRSAFDRMKAVGELDKALLEWRDALPLDIQPEKPIRVDEDRLLPIIIMHLAYFNCLSTIHRVSIHNGSWTTTHIDPSGTMLNDQHLNPRIYASQSICLSAARQSIALLPFVDFKAHSTGNSVIWFVYIFH